MLRLPFDLVGALAILGFVAVIGRAEPPRQPNIIFILADDLGWTDLACYGSDLHETPHLDRLATQGMRFTQCYAGSTVCAPSRCALMTGRHTGHCTVRGNALVPLRPEDVTVAGSLKKSGYATALIGKWGLGEPGTTGLPNRKGFDYFFGYLNQLHAHNYYPDYLWKNQDRFPLEGNVVKDGVASQRAQYSHDLFTREALQVVKQHRDAPFFLYLAYTIPHANNERGQVEDVAVEHLPEPVLERSGQRPGEGLVVMVGALAAGRGLVDVEQVEVGEIVKLPAAEPAQGEHGEALGEGTRVSGLGRRFGLPTPDT